MAKAFVQGPVEVPAAGTDFSFVVSSTDTFRLLSLRAVLSVAGGGGGDLPHLQFVTPSDDVFVECVPIATPSGGSTVTYQWTMQSGGAAINGEESDGVIGMALPVWSVPANTVVRVLTTSLGADDQWEKIYFTALVGEEREHLEWLKSIAGSVGNLDAMSLG